MVSSMDRVSWHMSGVWVPLCTSSIHLQDEVFKFAVVLQDATIISYSCKLKRMILKIRKAVSGMFPPQTVLCHMDLVIATRHIL